MLQITGSIQVYNTSLAIQCSNNFLGTYGEIQKIEPRLYNLNSKFEVVTSTFEFESLTIDDQLQSLAELVLTKEQRARVTGPKMISDIANDPNKKRKSTTQI